MEGTRNSGLFLTTFRISSTSKITRKIKPNPSRPANEFEIRDALLAIKQAGGRATRMYVISVRKENEPLDIVPMSRGRASSMKNIRAYDKVLQIANEVGVRVIMPSTIGGGGEGRKTTRHFVVRRKKNSGLILF